MGSNGKTLAQVFETEGEDPAKTLVYLGPSLPLARAKEILPHATYRPPARQGDVLTDLVNFKPARLLLIDSEFRQNLSVWHKELVYALQYPGLKGVYGAASMGALRAAELDYLGMIGVGEIYEWYRDGIIEDDSEVAVHYAVHKDRYRILTVPLVDIRAGVGKLREDNPGDPLADYAVEFLDKMIRVNYMDRTPELCQKEWDIPNVKFPCVAQKAADAELLLASYLDYLPQVEVKPEPDHLSGFFHAQFERDRRIRINGTEVAQANIEAHVLLHNPEFERICWDSANQELAFMLCNLLSVTVTMAEVESESTRFQNKAGLRTAEDFAQMLERNGWSRSEYDRLIIQNARIRKLQHTVTVSKMYRRNTQSILDYLRTHQDFEYWAREAAIAEEKLQRMGVDDWLDIDTETSAMLGLLEHFEREGMDLKVMPEDYLLETGFSNPQELGVALARINAGKEKHE